MNNLILVMMGGGLGAASRYGIGVLSVRYLGNGYAWGTLAVNLAGCFLVGLIFGLAEQKLWVGHSAKLFFMTGFLGAMTTFSAFGLETMIAARGGIWPHAVVNLLAHNVGGLLLVAVGLAAARLAR